MQKFRFEVDKVSHEMNPSLLINFGSSNESKKCSYVKLLRFIIVTVNEMRGDS